MSILPSRLLRDWPAAIIVAVVVLSTPETGFAGCGDYITYSQASSQDQTATTVPEGMMPIPAPCDGPNCSRQPDRDFPPIPPAPVPSPSKDQARSSDSDAAATHIPCTRFVRNREPAEAIHRPTSIFHPPRRG